MIEGILVVVSFIISLSVSFIQTKQFIGRGSDHLVHLFLIKVIRENKHRLFKTVPRMLNNAYCGAYPLFLHWTLSFFSEKTINKLALLLNPLVNALQVIVVYLLLKTADVSPTFRGLACLCFALTPQLYHAISARIYGISARPLGLILIVIYFSLCYEMSAVPVHFFGWVGVVLIGYLIWGGSTFAQQALLFISILQAVIFNNWALLIIALISMLLFVALHPVYAISYLKHTFLFSKTYATDLAKVFILKRRYSIWRDWVYDFWMAPFPSLKKRLLYIYDNSLFIVVLLNPLSMAASYAWWVNSDTPNNHLALYCSQIAVSAIALFLLTSFRFSRFLGEPERYVELVTVFSTIGGGAYLFENFGQDAILVVISYFVIVNILQLMTILFRDSIPKQHSDLSVIEQIVNKELAIEGVKFSSNNEELTKYLMTNPWRFAKTWSFEEKYAGFSIGETFSVFPCLNKIPFEIALAEYRVNAALLDKSLFADIFELDVTMREKMEVLFDTDKYRLYKINW